jgi:hypothetical protein
LLSTTAIARVSRSFLAPPLFEFDAPVTFTVLADCKAVSAFPTLPANAWIEDNESVAATMAVRVLLILFLLWLTRQGELGR